MTTTETFFVENIKCGGCANTIKCSLEKVLGIQSVEVYVEQDKVCNGHWCKQGYHIN